MMRRELLDFRGESGHRAREEPAVGEKDVQVAEGVEPVAEEMTPDEARRAGRLSRRRVA